MKIINMEDWNRAEHFKFFSSMDYPHYNICMNIDITNFLSKIREKKLPFYYAMIYASITAANETEEFKYRLHDGKVILQEKLHPSFTEITPGTEFFKIVTINMESSLEEFVPLAKQKADNQTVYFPFTELGRDDLIYITCIPWISFTHLSHTINLRKEDTTPRISWGKYFKEGDKVFLPFSVQVNHAFVDGIHVGKYVDRLQTYLDTFE